MARDFVAELLAVIRSTATGELERAIRQRWGGRTFYVSSATGRGDIQQLVSLGLPRRTAYWKVHGR